MTCVMVQSVSVVVSVTLTVSYRNVGNAESISISVLTLTVGSRGLLGSVKGLLRAVMLSCLRC